MIQKYLKNSILFNLLRSSRRFILKTIICLVYLPMAKNLDNDAYGYFTYAFENRGTLTYFGTKLIFRITY